MSKEKISKYLLSSCNKTLRLKMENYLFEEQAIEFSTSTLMERVAFPFSI